MITTKINITRTADTVRRAAEGLGYTASEHQASTGTVYLACAAGEVARKIRIADHSECYCTEDFSIDPEGYSAWQVVALLARDAGRPEPSWAKAARTRATAKKATAVAAEAARIATMQSINESCEQRTAAVHAWASEHCPDFLTASRDYLVPGKAARRRRQAASDRMLAAYQAAMEPMA